MTDNPLTVTKKIELEKFSFSDAQPVIIDSQDDQISIVQFWRVFQKRRWLVLGNRKESSDRRQADIDELIGAAVPDVIGR